jgi:chromosome segregation ATPase
VEFFCFQGQANVHEVAAEHAGMQILMDHYRDENPAFKMESTSDGEVGKFFKMVKTVSIKTNPKRKTESMTELNKKLKAELKALKAAHSQMAGSRDEGVAGSSEDQLRISALEQELSNVQEEKQNLEDSCAVLQAEKEVLAERVRSLEAANADITRRNSVLSNKMDFLKTWVQETVENDHRQAEQQ